MRIVRYSKVSDITGEGHPHYWLRIILIILTLGFSTITDLNAAVNKISSSKIIAYWLNVKAPNHFIGIPAKPDSILSVSGQVFDADEKTTMEEVNVTLKGASSGTKTNQHGNFTIKIPIKKFQKESHVLVFSYLGYSTQEIEIAYNHNGDLKVYLNPALEFIGQIHIPWHKRLWWRVSNAFRK
jgi:hypothetical protein